MNAPRTSQVPATAQQVAFKPIVRTRSEQDKTAGSDSSRLHAPSGNQGIQRALLTNLGIQPKLTVNQPGDVYEEEADRVADTVMRMEELGTPPAVGKGSVGVAQRMCTACAHEHEHDQETGIGKPGLQRACVECEREQEEKLHRKPADGEGSVPEVTRDVENRIGTLRGSGSSLSPELRERLEPRFNRDFGGVRVHTGGQAAETSRAVSARAFTVGRDIVFGAGEFSPHTTGGLRLLAHELTHVVQQGELGHQVQRMPSPAATAPNPISAGGTVDQRRVQRQVAPQTTVSAGSAPPPIQRSCPPAPTGMGSRPGQPDRDCSERSDTVGGAVFYFCTDSDVMTSEAMALLPRYAPLLGRLSVIEIHGYASPEGPPGLEVPYNLNLSCLRAGRVADELAKVGIAPGKIRLFKHGGTTVYGAGRLSRVVVVPVPNVHRQRVTAYSLLACAPCNPFTDDGLDALTPPASEPAIGSYRMRHWIEAEVLSVDGLHIDPGGSRLIDAGRTPGKSGYCGVKSDASVLSYTSPVGARLAAGPHGEGMEWKSELITQVGAKVPCTLPGAPCGELGPNPMIPPIRSQFGLRIFADGTKESAFLGASSFPFHYLYQNGSLKESGGAPVSPAVDFDAWATSTGVPRTLAEAGFKALRQACCFHGYFPGCACKCHQLADGGISLVDPDLSIDPPAEMQGCLVTGAVLALTSCPASCAPAGTSCSTLTRRANP